MPELRVQRLPPWDVYRWYPARTITSATPDFVYKALNQPRQIRLLYLKPAKDRSSLIQASLKLFTLQDKHARYDVAAFLAISYVWGESAITNPILLNEKRFEVRDNVHDLLLQVRHRWKVVRLWIDAICINQDNLPERSQQVSIMGDIYGSASSVLVWLGRGNEQTKMAVDLISRWAWMEIKHGSQQGTGVLTRYPGLWSESAWQALPTILKHPWFTRMWTFQEYVRGQDIVFQYGGRAMKDIDLWAAFCMWRKADEGLFLGVTPAQKQQLMATYNITLYTNRVVSRSLYHTFNGPEVLAELGETHPYDSHRIQRSIHTLGCSDPRDKLFALSAAIRTDDLSISPDYTRPVEEIFTEFAQKCIVTSSTLNIFDCAGIGIPTSATLLDLPSWVPDLRASSAWSSSLLRRGFAADTGLKANNICRIEGTVLHCNGYVIDTVTEVFPDTAQDVRKAWVARLVEDKHATSAKLPVLQALVRTMTLDTSKIIGNTVIHKDIQDAKSFDEAVLGFFFVQGLPMMESILENPEQREVFGTFAERHRLSVSDELHYFAAMTNDFPFPSTFTSNEAILAPFLKAPGSDIEIEWPSAQYKSQVQANIVRDGLPAPPGPDGVRDERQFCELKWVELSASNASGRSFFITTDGWIGLAPANTLPHDQICVLAGSSLPVVLRRDSTISDRYRLVGVCFVYGLMYGEALPADLESKLQEFKLV